MADMQLSVKEKKTKHNLKSVVKEDKEFSLIGQQDEKKADRISVPAFSVCAAAELRGRVYTITSALFGKGDQTWAFGA